MSGRESMSTYSVDLDLALSEIEGCPSSAELEVIRQKWIGRKGIVTIALRKHAERERVYRENERRIAAMDERVEAAYQRRLEELI